MTSSTSRDIPEMGEPTPCTVRNLQLTLFLHFRIVFFLFKVNESYKILPSQHKLLHKVGAKKARTFLEKKKKKTEVTRLSVEVGSYTNISPRLLCRVYQHKQSIINKETLHSGICFPATCTQLVVS